MGSEQIDPLDLSMATFLKQKEQERIDYAVTLYQTVSIMEEKLPEIPPPPPIKRYLQILTKSMAHHPDPLEGRLPAYPLPSDKRKELLALGVGGKADFSEALFGLQMELIGDRRRHAVYLADAPLPHIRRRGRPPLKKKEDVTQLNDQGRQRKRRGPKRKTQSVQTECLGNDQELQKN